MSAWDISTHRGQPGLGLRQGCQAHQLHQHVHLPSTIISIANNCTIDIFKVSEAEDMEKAAMAIHSDDVQLCRRLGQVLSSENNLNALVGFTNPDDYQAGASLLNGGILTICNTGALATGGHGTALGMVSAFSIMWGRF